VRFGGYNVWRDRAALKAEIDAIHFLI